ncbi:hypothetical protein WN943_004539 [Citrus x changshan-huyou]
MLQSAKLLHHKGFHITCVNTEFNHRCFLKSRGHHSLDGLPNFRFEAIPDVSCIISDDFMAFTITAAQRLGLPSALFFTISACSFKGLKQFQTLKEKGLFPLKDESCLKKEYLDSVMDWIPGMAA